MATKRKALIGIAGLCASLSGCEGYLDSDDEGRSGSGSRGVGGNSTNASSDPDGDEIIPTDPGRVTLHRLNNAEYNNTLRDLLGTQLRPADEFPLDNRGDGFDNIADVLTLSPLHVDLMYSAAESVVQSALGSATQRERIITCDLAEGEACLRASLLQFASLAWRRPVTEDEVDRLLAVTQVALDAGDSGEVGLELALRAVLFSPHFLFRVELDPDPTSLTPHPLSAYELASRLSYFLWSSMPDEELFAVAAADTLNDHAALEEQVRRMLEDERAAALIDNFGGQWLGLRSVTTLAPDGTLFPGFDESLRAAIYEETALMFREVVFNGLPVDEFLTADFTFANDRLAQHYGLPAVGSDEHQRVDLTGMNERRGFLGHASFLTQTSHADRTSLVNRGIWVLNQLLCTEIPAPPPDVSTEAVEIEESEGLTQREALEQHRADPSCNTCHQLIDPIGFGLENFDAIGAFRTIDGAGPIDAAGELPNGGAFSGAGELAELIAEDPKFGACLTRKLYTYALGRAPEEAEQHLDDSTLELLSSRLSEEGFDFGALIGSIASSETFRNRRGEEINP